MKNTSFAAIFLMTCWLALIALPGQSSRAQEIEYFHIQVVDEETGRGVPLIELKTVNNLRFISDSAGNIAFHEPGQMNKDVFFHVAGHGYQYKADGFGYRGLRLKTAPGAKSTIKIRRVNLAERLYRITGAGIYRDTALLKLAPPIEKPLVNGGVLGSDSIVNAIYRGKLYWFWGDTNRATYPLGNFQVAGATSELPKQIDPSVGINLNYFVDAQGFAKQMAPVPGKGPTWIFGLLTFRDAEGQERMLAKYEKIKPPMEAYERGLVLFNDSQQQFEKLAQFDLAAPLFPRGQTMRLKTNDSDHFYFATPFPLVRVQANLEAIKDTNRYEAFTYFKSNVPVLKNEKGEFQFAADQLDRGADGKLILRWRPNAFPISPRVENSLIKQKLIGAQESCTLVQDIDSGKTIQLASGSVAWNEFRKKWVMIAVQAWGNSMLGEVWYAEADAPEGPWRLAKKIVTHDDYSFYNPRHHPYFDQDEGRTIYFEGTYTKMFSGSKVGTPRYDYNQILYRLDLNRIPSMVKSHRNGNPTR